MGVKVKRVYAFAFAFGVLLAAFAGALTAPKISVQPGLSSDVIILSFAIVVIGGLGSVEGAAVGAILVGLARATSVHLLPQAELFMIYLIMAAVLMFRPKACSSARRQGGFDETRPASRRHDRPGDRSGAVRPRAADLDAVAGDGRRLQRADRARHRGAGAHRQRVVRPRVVLRRRRLRRGADRQRLGHHRRGGAGDRSAPSAAACSGW